MTATLLLENGFGRKKLSEANGCYRKKVTQNNLSLV